MLYKRTCSPHLHKAGPWGSHWTIQPLDQLQPQRTQSSGQTESWKVLTFKEAPSPSLGLWIRTKIAGKQRVVSLRGSIHCSLQTALSLLLCTMYAQLNVKAQGSARYRQRLYDTACTCQPWPLHRELVLGRSCTLLLCA